MEVWKSIPGTGETYEVSDLGRVRSRDRVIFRKDGTSYKAYGHVLKPVPNSTGYMRVQIFKDGRKQAIFVHRLVAEAFVQNPRDKNCVNHKDFDPKNNAASNLEWVSHAENMRYSLDRGRFDRTDLWLLNQKRALEEKMGRPIIGTSLKSGKELRYTVLNDCKKDGFQPSCVSNCCNGKRKTHKGYLWRFSEVSV